MLRKGLIFLAVCLLIIPVAISVAQDNGESSSTDPYQCTADGSNGIQCNTPQDNECFEGGDWAGSCTTDGQWICGWYLARYTDGIFSYEAVPEWCNIEPPPPPPPSDGADDLPEPPVDPCSTTTLDAGTCSTITITFTTTGPL